MNQGTRGSVNRDILRRGFRRKYVGGDSCRVLRLNRIVCSAGCTAAPRSVVA